MSQKKLKRQPHFFLIPICFESIRSIVPSFYQFICLLNISCGLSCRGYAPTAHTYSTCITKHLVYCQTSLKASQKECSGNCFGGILIASLQSFTLSIYRGMCLSPTAVLGHVKDPQCYETYAFIITKCLGANKTDHILSVETTSNYCLCSWLHSLEMDTDSGDLWYLFYGLLSLTCLIS